MCGIVGYHGKKNPKDVIIEGLQTLEYRGYDSAGISVFHEGKIKRVRAEGKLVNLKTQIENQEFNGHSGIGHTRWATHGVPSEKNAHPHLIDGVSIVHNGIIENYLEIREELLKDNVVIHSDTDSELVAHLISRELKNTENFLQSVLNVIPKLKGAYSIVAIWEQNPEEMIAFKSGPPLVFGIGDGEFVISSDIQAIVPHTKKVIYLEDSEVLYVNGSNYQVMCPAGKEIPKEIVEIQWNAEKAEKQGYPHFMLKEIFEQPRTVAAAMKPHVNLESMETEFKNIEGIADNVERILIVACGTSYYAGMVGEYLLEKIAKIPTEVELASEFRYRQPILQPNTLAVFISQSGETADTMAAFKLAKEHGVKTLSICNVPHSTLNRETDYQLYMNCDVEIGVASTKAFTSSLTLLNLLSLYLGKKRGQLLPEHEQEILRQLIDLPSNMEKVLAHGTFFKEAAETLKKYRGFLYISRGVNYPIALEGALKMKELTYLHAEGYAAGEMKHGPIALIDSNMMVVVIAPEDDVFEKTVSNLEEICARGGHVISVSTLQNEKMMRLSDHYLPMPQTHWSLNPILSVIPLQLMSYHLSDSLGLDVDQPRNLAKSVTVE